MEKYPLTNLGIASLVANLYSLPQEDLQNEIDALAQNFNLWIVSHISLNAEQETYFLSLPSAFKKNLQDKLINSLSNRSSIVFTKDESNQAEKSNAEGRGKLFGVDDKSTSSYSSDIGTIVDETLHVYINYSN